MPGRQSISTAHCAGFRRREAAHRAGFRLPAWECAGSAAPTPQYRRAKRSKATATASCPKATGVMPSTTQRSKGPWKARGELVRGSTAVHHPSRSRAPRNSRVLSHDTEFMLKVNGKRPGVTSTFPLRAQNIRYDTQVGRMITSQPNSQGNMSATEGRQPGRTVRQPHYLSGAGTAVPSRLLCGQGDPLPPCREKQRSRSTPSGRSHGGTVTKSWLKQWFWLHWGAARWPGVFNSDASTLKSDQGVST